jgi:hypothetical protein
MNLRQPMHPFVQNTLILVTSGIVASLLCAKVYGATLPVEEPAPPAPAPAPIAAVAPAPAQAAKTDVEAAAQLRAMLLGQRELLGVPVVVGANGR